MIELPHEDLDVGLARLVAQTEALIAIDHHLVAQHKILHRVFQFGYKLTIVFLLGLRKLVKVD